MTLARRLLVSGLILGLVIRIVVLPLPGTGDVLIWKVWSAGAVTDLTGVYGGGDPPAPAAPSWNGHQYAVDKPPVTIYELAVVGHMYRAIYPAFNDSRLFTPFLKIPGIIAEASLILLTLTWGRRRFGEDAAAWTALAIWLNPTVLINGAVLGYLDAQMAVPLVMAVVAAVAGPAWLAGSMVAVAALTKPQAIVALPPVVAHLIWRLSVRWRAVVTMLCSGGLVVLLGCVPYVLRGSWNSFVAAMKDVTMQDMVSGQAANLWWIFTWVQQARESLATLGWARVWTQVVQITSITDTVARGYPNPRLVGNALLATAVAWVMWRARSASTPGEATALAAWCAYAYVVFATGVHENHQSTVVPLLGVAAGLAPAYRRVFWWVSLVTALNMYLFYGFGERWIPPIFDRTSTIIDDTVLLSFVNIGVFVWFTRVLVTRFREGYAAAG